MKKSVIFIALAFILSLILSLCALAADDGVISKTVLFKVSDKNN